MQLSEVLDMLNHRIAALEHTVNDVLVKSLVEANDQYEYDQGLEAFKGRYPDAAALDGPFSALKGEQYDTAKALYDQLPKDRDDTFDEAQFVADALAEMNAKLDALVAARTPAEEEAAAEAEAETAPTEEAEKPEEAEEVTEEQLAEELKAAKN